MSTPTTSRSTSLQVHPKDRKTAVVYDNNVTAVRETTMVKWQDTDWKPETDTRPKLVTASTGPGSKVISKESVRSWRNDQAGQRCQSDRGLPSLLHIQPLIITWTKFHTWARWWHLNRLHDTWATPSTEEDHEMWLKPCVENFFLFFL